MTLATVSKNNVSSMTLIKVSKNNNVSSMTLTKVSKIVDASSMTLINDNTPNLHLRSNTALHSCSMPSNFRNIGLSMDTDNKKHVQSVEKQRKQPTTPRDTARSVNYITSEMRMHSSHN